MHRWKKRVPAAQPCLSCALLFSSLVNFDSSWDAEIFSNDVSIDTFDSFFTSQTVTVDRSYAGTPGKIEFTGFTANGATIGTTPGTNVITQTPFTFTFPGQ